MKSTHARELERLREENAKEIEKDRHDTRLTVEIMQKVNVVLLTFFSCPSALHFTFLSSLV